MGNETSLSKDSSTSELPYSKVFLPRSHSDSKLQDMTIKNVNFNEQNQKFQRVKNNYIRFYQAYKIRKLCQKVKKSILQRELIDKAKVKNTKEEVFSQLRTFVKNKSIKKDLHSHFNNKTKCYGQVLEDLVNSRTQVDPFVIDKLKILESKCKERNERRKMKMEDKTIQTKIKESSINLTQDQYNYLLTRIKNLELQVETLVNWKNEMQRNVGLINKRTNTNMYLK